jgi:hypothetical protein
VVSTIKLYFPLYVEPFPGGFINRIITGITQRALKLLSNVKLHSHEQ